MKVLVVGGAGDVGRMILPTLSQQAEVVVLDRRADGLPGGVRYIEGDATSYASVREAATECQALVYLAMGPKQGWNSGPEWAAKHFDVNIKGVYQSLTAAADAGCAQAVLASSMSVFADYLAPGDRDPDATDVYGLTKRLGEQAARALAETRKLPVVALRLVGPMSDDEWNRYRDPRLENVVTSGSDVARAFLSALGHRNSGYFDSFVISGDWAGEDLDLTRSRELLGWEPLARRTPDGAEEGHRGQAGPGSSPEAPG